LHDSRTAGDKVIVVWEMCLHRPARHTESLPDIMGCLLQSLKDGAGRPV